MYGSRSLRKYPILTQPLRKTSEMVESVWASMGYFLDDLDPNMRKIT